MATVTPLPDRLERIARAIKVNLATAASGDAAWIDGMVAAGTKIAEARSLHKDDIGFGQWWDAQGFGLNHQARAALVAMGQNPEEMLKVLKETDRRSIRYIYEEHKARFTHVGKPARRSGGAAKKAPRRNEGSQSAKIREWCLGQLGAGRSLSEDIVAKEFGLRKGSKAVQIALYEARAHHRERTEPQVARADLSMSAQQKFDAAIAREIKRLQIENEAWRRAEVERQRKRLIEERLPHWEADARRARLHRETLEKRLNNLKSPLTLSEFRLLALAIQSNASEETRHKAGVLLNAKKLILTGED